MEQSQQGSLRDEDEMPQYWVLEKMEGLSTVIKEVTQNQEQAIKEMRIAERRADINGTGEERRGDG